VSAAPYVVSTPLPPFYGLSINLHDVLSLPDAGRVNQLFHYQDMVKSSAVAYEIQVEIVMVMFEV
jgi:hypothetical protein